MPALASVTAAELAKTPMSRLWALIDYLAEDASRITRRFRPIWLLWAYDAEVKNGGHLQYFHNRGVEDVPETLDALKAIGAHDQASLLNACWEVIKQSPITRVSTLRDYSELAEERSFGEDKAYYSLKPELVELLERHNREFLSEVVEVRV